MAWAKSLTTLMFSIFSIVFFAVFLGIVLALFITRGAKPLGYPLVPPEEDSEKDIKGIRPLTFDDLFQLGEELCKENNLRVKEKTPVSEEEVYWIAESANAFFQGNYVLGFFKPSEKNPFVTLSTILEFKDFVKSATSTKGLFFNAGFFTRDVLQPLEGPRVTLYNRLRIISEFKRLGLSLT